MLPTDKFKPVQSWILPITTPGRWWLRDLIKVEKHFYWLFEVGTVLDTFLQYLIANLSYRRRMYIKM